MVPIEICNLRKVFAKKQIGVADVTLTVKQGDIFGLIGPDGAGKSTTIKVLMGIMRASEGYANLTGEDAFKKGKLARAEVGYVPENVVYPSNKTVKNILMYVAKVRDRGWQRIDSLCTKLELNINKKFGELSLSNQKKVAIVAAIMAQPKVLVLDEPTKGLEPVARKAFLDLLLEENKKGTTIFISSSNLVDIQRICNRVAIIKNGKVISVEEMENLKNKLLKVVSFETKQSEPEITLSGVSNLVKEGNFYKFTYNGEIELLVKYLGAIDIRDLRIEDASLDDIFTRFYE